MTFVPEPSTAIKGKVLVVDDQKSLAMLAEQVIRAETDFEVVLAHSAAQMTEALRTAGPFTSAVVDLVLPDASEGQHVREVVAQGVPTIVLTGSFDPSFRTRLLNQGVSDYVLKANANAYVEVAMLVQRLARNRACPLLVVDDQRTSRELFSAVLKRRCFDVTTAASVAEALTLVAERSFRIVLIDYVLPDGSGVELVEKLRRSYPKRDLSIIGISSSDGSTLGVRFLKAGANDFLRLPFLDEELVCRVEQNAELVETIQQFRDAALRDYLTGLYNRRYFFEAGGLLIENARRRNLSLSCAVFDIDRFKQINDSLGHDAGDLALRHVSRVLKQNLRGADLLARLGGEEFVALFVNTDIQGARMCAEKLRLAVQNDPVTALSVPVNVTLSAGVASGADSLEGMIRRADEALYAAKAGGRNRVCVSDVRP